MLKAIPQSKRIGVLMRKARYGCTALHVAVGRSSLAEVNIPNKGDKNSRELQVKARGPT